MPVVITDDTDLFGAERSNAQLRSRHLSHVATHAALFRYGANESDYTV